MLILLIFVNIKLSLAPLYVPQAVGLSWTNMDTTQISNFGNAFTIFIVSRLTVATSSQAENGQFETLRR